MARLPAKRTEGVLRKNPTISWWMLILTTSLARQVTRDTHASQHAAQAGDHKLARKLAGRSRLAFAALDLIAWWHR